MIPRLGAVTHDRRDDRRADEQQQQVALELPYEHLGGRAPWLRKTFGPSRASRLAASSPERPAALVPSRSSTSSTEIAAARRRSKRLVAARLRRGRSPFANRAHAETLSSRLDRRPDRPLSA